MTAAGPEPGRGFARLARDSALYVAGPAVGKVVGVLLVPVLARWLPTAEFGKADLFSAVQSTGASLALLGLDLAATRRYADHDDPDRDHVFGSWMALAGSVAAVMLAVAIVAARPLSELLVDDGRHASAVALTGAAVVGSVVQIVALTAVRNQGRAAAHAAISAATFVLYGALAVVLADRRPDATSVVAALAVSLGVGAVAAVIAAWPLLRHGSSRAATRGLLRLGLPVLPAVVATWVAEVVNRSILIRRASATEAAYFSLATRISSIVVLVVLGFQMAWQPAAFADGVTDDGRRRVALDGRRILTGVAVVVAATALVTPEAVRLVAGSTYVPATRAVGVALVAALAYGALQVATMPSSLTMQMRDVGIATALAAVGGMALNGWWAHRGAWATAAAIAVATAAGAVAAAVLGRRRVVIDFGLVRLSVVAASAGAVALAATWNGDAGVGFRLVLGIALLAVLLVEGSAVEVVSALARRRATPH